MLEDSGTNFFSLPLEIRQAIYSEAFGPTKQAVVTCNRIDSDAFLTMPKTPTEQQYSCPRSGQLLRVCKAICQEARPILYSQTTFHMCNLAFAGKMPTTFSEDSHPYSRHIRHLSWQVECDMMKHLYTEDLKLEKGDFANLQSLAIQARAEIWRDSFLGEACDREKFNAGRDQTLQYARILKELMEDKSRNQEIDLVEDRTFLGRGCVRFRLSRRGWRPRGERRLLANEVLIS